MQKLEPWEMPGGSGLGTILSSTGGGVGKKDIGNAWGEQTDGEVGGCLGDLVNFPLLLSINQRQIKSETFYFQKLKTSSFLFI